MKRLGTSGVLGILMVPLAMTLAPGNVGAELVSAREGESPAERLIAGVEDPGLRAILGEILTGNPEVAAAEARARAAEQRAPQVRALPDPTAMVTAYHSTPETRVGPQRLIVTLTQALPWLSKLDDQEQMAVWDALALRAETEALRLHKLTEARRLWWEIAFLDKLTEIQHHKHGHLLQHEEAARARYATGAGESQGVVKIQAEITRAEAELLDLGSRRASLVAQLLGLTGRLPGDPPLPIEPGDPLDPPDAEADPEIAWTVADLLPLAELHRPEVTAAEAAIERARVAHRLAEKGKRPDFTVGLTYTLIDPRDDLPGRLAPPERNGEDVLGIQGGIRVPLWRQRIEAGILEAEEMETAATEARRGTVVGIERQLADLTARLPLIERRLVLFEEVLLLQAEESMRSAEAGYVSGRFSALDLLHAHHVLFDSQIAAARARADLVIALAELEGAVGAPRGDFSHD